MEPGAIVIQLHRKRGFQMEGNYDVLENILESAEIEFCDIEELEEMITPGSVL